jgi:hypothetical protein
MLWSITGVILNSSNGHRRESLDTITKMLEFLSFSSLYASSHISLSEEDNLEWDFREGGATRDVKPCVNELTHDKECSPLVEVEP